MSWTVHAPAVVFASAAVRMVRCIVQAQARVVVCVKELLRAVMYSLVRVSLAGMRALVVWLAVAGVCERATVGLLLAASPSSEA